MNESLRNMLINDLSPVFVSQLIEIANWVYRDAYGAIYSDSSYDDSEKKYILPHTRRAKFEKKAREIALDCGLKTTIEQNIVKNTEYTLIKCGRFAFTISKTSGKSQLPAKSDFRKQYSEINQHLLQMPLFQIISEPKNTSIYGIIIHEHNPFKQDELGFLRIGFPDPIKHKWAEEPVDLIDIMESQTLLSQKQSANDEKSYDIDRQPKPKERYIVMTEEEERK